MKPTAGQKVLLTALTVPGRYVARVYDEKRQRWRYELRTKTGRRVEGTMADVRTVEACVQRGWLITEDGTGAADPSTVCMVLAEAGRAARLA